MDIQKEFNDKELTLLINGRVDTYTAPELETAINEELDNINSLILDFQNLEYISSAGLRVLVATQKKAKKQDFIFKIKNVNDVVNEILRMSKFDKILTIE
ncbi:MAG: STAS domain-containing protein [Methanobacteriaceae archaeon]|nr:STAS domain-containing protein [Methanobacteriaceae archaeon]